MKKIIHVEQSDFFRKLVRAFLTEQGFLVDSFDHGGIALVAMNAEDVGLIITGLSFPDMDSPEFLKKAAANPHKIPIIAFSSTQDPEMDRFLRELGIKTRVLKSGEWKEYLLPEINKYFVD